MNGNKSKIHNTHTSLHMERNNTDSSIVGNELLLGSNQRDPPDTVFQRRSGGGLHLDHVAHEGSQSTVQWLAVLGVSAVCVLQWRDILNGVASLVYGPRLERILVTWERDTTMLNLSRVLYIYR